MTGRNYFKTTLLLAGLSGLLLAIGALLGGNWITIMLIIAIAAVLQILVHLHFFLHINFTTTPKENLMAIAFTAVLIFLMVGGSLWIMIDLHQRMAI